MHKKYLLTLIVLLMSVYAIGQPKTEWFVSLNGNMSYPLQTKFKTAYPVLWFGKGIKKENTVLIGGFGAGASAYRALSKKFVLKGQANFSRHVYYDETLLTSIAEFYSRADEYTIGLTLTGNYFLSTRFGIGTGIGEQTMIYSATTIGFGSGFISNGEPKDKIRIRTHHYTPVLLTVPVEVCLKFNRTLLNVRYEHSLTNKLRGDTDFKEKFGLLFVELGFKIN